MLCFGLINTVLFNLSCVWIKWKLESISITIRTGYWHDLKSYRQKPQFWFLTGEISILISTGKIWNPARFWFVPWHIIFIQWYIHSIRIDLSPVDDGSRAGLKLVTRQHWHVKQLFALEAPRHEKTKYTRGEDGTSAERLVTLRKSLRSSVCCPLWGLGTWQSMTGLLGYIVTRRLGCTLTVDFF